MLMQLDHSKVKPLLTDYTLEQFMTEQKRANQVIKTLEKMASTMEKFENLGILLTHRLNQVEKKLKKFGKR